MTSRTAAVIAVITALVVGTACSSSHQGSAATTAPSGINKIRHIIVIMQENRSFDTYFGTYPGADGIPMRNGVPTVCVNDPRLHTCTKPFVDHRDVNEGGPHGAVSATDDVDGGKMDGFIDQAQRARPKCANVDDPACANPLTPDIMGYHTQSDIPNYWKYAQQFVLQDHMFSSVASWSLPAHLYEVSAWSARCTQHNPMSCTTDLNKAGGGKKLRDSGGSIFAWTDITYLLHKHNVPWAYYVVTGDEPDCQNPEALSCSPVKQNAKTPSIWNPLPAFDTVKSDGQVGNVTSVSHFYAAAKAGTLPAVSWVVPSNRVSEHPPAPVSAGQSYVTSLINAVMKSPDWSSTAIFLAWDDWGGFYDNVVPVKVDPEGYGLRVPALVISPYAKKGYVDHQVLSFDAYLKFIEDDFLGGQRLDPKTDGRPDPRPDVREDASQLGDLLSDFDFQQAPRAPLILPVHPQTTLTG